MRSAVANKFLTEQRGTSLETSWIEIEIPASPVQAHVNTGAHSYARAIIDAHQHRGRGLSR
jgi:hypothetical protein